MERNSSARANSAHQHAGKRAWFKKRRFSGKWAHSRDLSGPCLKARFREPQLRSTLADEPLSPRTGCRSQALGDWQIETIVSAGVEGGDSLAEAPSQTGLLEPVWAGQFSPGVRAPIRSSSVAGCPWVISAPKSRHLIACQHEGGRFVRREDAPQIASLRKKKPASLRSGSLPSNESASLRSVMTTAPSPGERPFDA